MFRSKTLLIVGAGASKEFDLPIGAELKNIISSIVDIRFANGFEQSSGDTLLTEALRRKVVNPLTGNRGDINNYLRAAWRTRDAMPQAISIDNFIDAHRDDKEIEFVGKISIVRSILQAERRSKIYVDMRETQKIDFRRIDNTWLAAFFRLATETIAKSDAASAFENVSFITFNYDRCIEHFLMHALKNYYNFDENESQRIVSSISIIHPYGQVGCLPWQAGENKTPFGGLDHDGGENILKISSQIKTFTERVENEDALLSIRQKVQQAETIIFLGFAFHPMNMELIAPQVASNARRIFGTAKGMSDSDTISIADDLSKWLKRKPQYFEMELRNRLTCSELFGEFWRSMPRPIA